MPYLVKNKLIKQNWINGLFNDLKCHSEPALAGEESQF